MLRGALFLACIAFLAGCGGGSGSPHRNTPGSAATCRSPAAQRALARIATDLTAIKAASALPVHDSLKGNAAVNRATDRFLLHVSTAPLDNLVRNRMIDHATALLLGACEQCFQALEAARPIVSIAHAHSGTPCHAKS